MGFRDRDAPEPRHAAVTLLEVEAGAGEGAVDPYSELVASRLLKQLCSFQGCTKEAHANHEQEHSQLHRKNGAYTTLADLLRW